MPQTTDKKEDPDRENADEQAEAASGQERSVSPVQKPNPSKPRQKPQPHGSQPRRDQQQHPQPLGPQAEPQPTSDYVHTRAEPLYREGPVGQDAAWRRLLVRLRLLHTTNGPSNRPVSTTIYPTSCSTGTFGSLPPQFSSAYYIRRLRERPGFQQLKGVGTKGAWISRAPNGGGTILALVKLKCNFRPSEPLLLDPLRQRRFSPSLRQVITAVDASGRPEERLTRTRASRQNGEADLTQETSDEQSDRERRWTAAPLDGLEGNTPCSFLWMIAAWKLSCAEII